VKQQHIPVHQETPPAGGDTAAAAVELAPLPVALGGRSHGFFVPRREHGKARLLGIKLYSTEHEANDHKRSLCKMTKDHDLNPWCEVQQILHAPEAAQNGQ
jgi:hypothetical protein